jgi:hypothetical protein
MEKPIMNMPRMVSLDQYLMQLSTLLCSKYVSLRGGGASYVSLLFSV